MHPESRSFASRPPSLGAGAGAGSWRAPLSLLLLTTLAACGAATGTGGASGTAPAAPSLNLSAWQIVDLTHSLSPDSLYWPNGEPFEFERQTWGYDDDGNWYAMARFSTPEHLGTHLDAPIHFAADGWTNDQIPIQRLIGPAVVIDISDRADNDPDTVLEPADIDAWEAEHGPAPAGAIVVVRTGWSSRWPDWNTYYGSEDPFDTTTLHFPGVSAEAAERIVAGDFVGVGIDTASIDTGADTAFPAHRVLGAGALYNLENLTGLEALPATGAYLFALPAKIEGGSGGPARVVALVPGTE